MMYNAQNRLGLRTSSIVRNSNKLENITFREQHFFPSSDQRADAYSTTNWFLISQETAFFVVTALKTSNLT
jgi:hypothetical protein